MRSTGCDDYDFLVHSGHTDAFDYPISREALSVTSRWGGRRLAEVPANTISSLLDDFQFQDDLIADDLSVDDLQDDIIADDLQDDVPASEKSQDIAKCIAAFNLNKLKSWCDFRFICFLIRFFFFKSVSYNVF